MKNSLLLIGLVALTISLTNCNSETKSACFDQSNLAACNELCDIKNDAKACEKATNLSIDACIKNDDLQVCGTACLMAKSGNEIFCKKKDELCQLDKYKNDDNFCAN